MSGSISLFLFIFLLVLMAGLFHWQATRLRRASGLPAGRITYNDARAERGDVRPLVDRELGLVGKPDYLVELENGAMIPVEVKSGQAPRSPYAGHVLQLAAYCLLVESTFGRRPPFGILRYADHEFELDFTRNLEEELLELLDYMREDLQEPEVPRSHHEPARCAGCGVRPHCTASLV